MKLLVAALAALALLAGCGGGSDDELSADENFAVLNFSASSLFACRDVNEDPGANADAALAVLREQPEAVPPDDAEGRTVREIMATAANNLAPCEPELAQRIEAALP